MRRPGNGKQTPLIFFDLRTSVIKPERENLKLVAKQVERSSELK